MPTVFISYRRADSSASSGRIYDTLVARLGRNNVYKDVDDIPPGADFADHIQASLRRCAVQLVIIGTTWLESLDAQGQRRLEDPADAVRIEIETALALRLTVLPLLVDGATMPAAADLPESLRKLPRLNALQVRHDADFTRDMERVILAIEAAAGIERTSRQAVDGTRSVGTSSNQLLSRATETSYGPHPSSGVTAERSAFFVGVRLVMLIILLFLAANVVATLFFIVQSMAAGHSLSESVNGVYLFQVAARYPVAFTGVSLVTLAIIALGVGLDRRFAKRTTNPSEPTLSPLTTALRYDDAARSAATPDGGSADSDLVRDWGDAPAVASLYGRDRELNIIRQSLTNDGCRVLALLGIGGVGKSTLAATAARTIADGFDCVIWRSLSNAPPPEEVISKCIQATSGHRDIAVPASIESQITALIGYLRRRPCLIVLDNFESVMQSGARTGQYRHGYEGFGQLIQRLGETGHRSCLVITSREKPKEIGMLEGTSGPVRSLLLAGLDAQSASSMLSQSGIHGSDQAWSELTRMYAGNPLFLRLVAQAIREVFAGDIDEFLAQGQAVFGDLRDPLDFQFARLAELEREVMYWLAVERHPLTLSGLQANFVRPLPPAGVIEAVDSLRRRSLIDLTETSLFTLQPVVLEYVTDQFIDGAAKELLLGQTHLIARHAFIKAQANDYVRNAQTRLVLAPISETLSGSLAPEDVRGRLQSLLDAVRGKPTQSAGYVAGNVLNLLVFRKDPVREFDFSDTVIIQPFLQGAQLQDALFVRATFEQPAFTQTFGVILAVSLTRDAERLAAASADGELRLWRTSDAAPLLSRKAHSGWVRAMANDPAGKRIASGGDDQIARIWDAGNGECLLTLEGHTDWVLSVSWSPNGRYLVTTSQDQTLRLWDTTSGAAVRTLRGHTGGVLAAAFSPDGASLVSASEDKSLRLWDVATGDCIRVLEGHEGSILDVTYSPDAQYLASGGEDSALRVWDASTGSCVQTLQGHSGRVRAVAWSPEGNMLISAGDDHAIRVWNALSAKSIQVMQGHTRSVRSLDTAATGRLVVSGSEDQTVRVWDVVTGECVRVLQGYTTWVWGVAFGPDGRTLASTEDQRMNLWNAQSGERMRSFDNSGVWIWSLAYTGDGAYLVSGNDDDTVKVWDVANGQCVRTLTGHASWVWGVAVSPDSTRVISGAEDNVAKIWDLHSGACLHTLEGHQKRIRAVAFSPNGSSAATGSDDGTVRLWDTSTGACLMVLQGHTGWAWAVAFSPDGLLLASGSDDRTVRLWNVATGEQVATIEGHPSWIRTVAFSHSGQLLAAGGEDGSARIYDIGALRWTKVYGSETSRMRSVAFSPDDVYLATGGEDGMVKLWNIETGVCERVFRGDRPYERMDITGSSGLTPAQREALQALGAVD